VAEIQQSVLMRHGAIEIYHDVQAIGANADSDTEQGRRG
jgi:hypothetical protein